MRVRRQDSGDVDENMATSKRPTVRMNVELIRYVECVKYLVVRVSGIIYFEVHFVRMRMKVTKNCVDE